MDQHSLQTFLQNTKQDETEHDYFEIEKPQMLEINLKNQAVWTKIGSMIAYTGSIQFARQGTFAGGIGNFIKKKLTGEGAKLMKAEGTGRVYVADRGKKVQVLQLQNEHISVNGNDILAHDQSISNRITMLQSISGMMAGGLFQVSLKGTGYVALTTHGDPLTLMVTPENPVYTDPNATVAWAGHLTPQIKTNVSFKSILGRGSGEEFQMKFSGEGWVLVQPYEEIYFQQK